MLLHESSRPKRDGEGMSTGVWMGYLILSTAINIQTHIETDKIQPST